MVTEMSFSVLCFGASKSKSADLIYLVEEITGNNEFREFVLSLQLAENLFSDPELGTYHQISMSVFLLFFSRALFTIIGLDFLILFI